MRSLRRPEVRKPSSISGAYQAQSVAITYMARMVTGLAKVVWVEVFPTPSSINISRLKRSVRRVKRSMQAR